VPREALERAQALAGEGKDAEALEGVRAFLGRYRTDTALLPDAVRLEVELLRRTRSPDYAEAAKRAAKDLSVYPPPAPGLPAEGPPKEGAPTAPPAGR